MDAADSPPESEDATGTVRLSTGEVVDLPLSTRATMVGATFSADRERAAGLLPDGLSALPTGPGRAAVTFLSVEYHRVGTRGEFEPYGEFGVLVPAALGETVDKSPLADLPLAGELPRGVGGYVWYLPVTTEPARALGTEVWGYSKVVADVSFADRGRVRRTTVTVDGDRLLTLDVRRPRTVSASVSGRSYTEKNGQLLSEPLELDGELGAWALGGADYDLGDHPRADRLRDLDMGSRPLLRFAGDVEFVIGPGEVVNTG